MTAGSRNTQTELTVRDGAHKVYQQSAAAASTVQSISVALIRYQRQRSTKSRDDDAADASEWCGDLYATRVLSTVWSRGSECSRQTDGRCTAA